MSELICILVNIAMQAERQARANGYKPKTVQTQVSKITFAMSQVKRLPQVEVNPFGLTKKESSLKG